MKLVPERTVVPSMFRLQQRMNRLFDNFFDGGEEFPAMEGFTPSIDLMDSPEKLVVKAEVPGVDPNEIEISVQDNVLTLTGEKKSEKEEKGKTWYRRESMYGKFSRSIPLPAAILGDKIEAATDAGVLTITLPKSETAKPRKIAVKTKK